MYATYHIFMMVSTSTQHGRKLQLGDYLHDWDRSKMGKNRRGYAAKNFTFVPAILSVAPEFLRLLLVMAVL